MRSKSKSLKVPINIKKTKDWQNYERYRSLVVMGIEEEPQPTHGQTLINFWEHTSQQVQSQQQKRLSTVKVVVILALTTAIATVLPITGYFRLIASIGIALVVTSTLFMILKQISAWRQRSTKSKGGGPGVALEESE